MQISKLSPIAYAAALVCSASLAACSKTITVPEEDRTPPDIWLNVFGAGDPLKLVPGDANASANVGAEAEIILIATARDQDGGIKNVRIGGAATVMCQPTGVSVHFVNQNPESDDVGPGDEAQDTRSTTMHIKVAELKGFCSGDSVFQSLSAGFQASAENFHGGTASSPAFSFSHP